jgi:hypothetical protein
MNSPKEKAEELVDKFLKSLCDDGSLSFKRLLYKYAKKCAIVAVDEILDAITFNMYDEEEYNKVNDYWQEVKHELEQL